MLRGISDPEMPWLGFILGQTPATIWYWCSDQMMVQRTLAAKSLSHVRIPVGIALSRLRLCNVVSLYSTPSLFLIDPVLTQIVTSFCRLRVLLYLLVT